MADEATPQMRQWDRLEELIAAWHRDNNRWLNACHDEADVPAWAEKIAALERDLRAKGLSDEDKDEFKRELDGAKDRAAKCRERREWAAGELQEIDDLLTALAPDLLNPNTCPILTFATEPSDEEIDRVAVQWRRLGGLVAARRIAAERNCTATHSDDFATVNWFGTPYTFTPGQRDAVKALWKCWSQGGHGMGQAAILEAAGSDTKRLRDVFKTAKGYHPAWGTMIAADPDAKDVWRLVPPEK